MGKVIDIKSRSKGQESAGRSHDCGRGIGGVIKFRSLARREESAPDQIAEMNRNRAVAIQKANDSSGKLRIEEGEENRRESLILMALILVAGGATIGGVLVSGGGSSPTWMIISSLITAVGIHMLGRSLSRVAEKQKSEWPLLSLAEIYRGEGADASDEVDIDHMVRTGGVKSISERPRSRPRLVR